MYPSRRNLLLQRFDETTERSYEQASRRRNMKRKRWRRRI
jgi:hypothetical protein